MPEVFPVSSVVRRDRREHWGDRHVMRERARATSLFFYDCNRRTRDLLRLWPKETQ